MRIAFRVDASLQIGSGHVMRCLTLAEGLRDLGAEVCFVSREIKGNLLQLIRNRGFKVKALAPPDSPSGPLAWTPHASWLETDWERDAVETGQALSAEGGAFDWLVVDHYALDRKWESRLRPLAARIMVIDDLADRLHDCDLLLDQNFYADLEKRYENLVPGGCLSLLGPHYALLRQEFLAKRKQLRQSRGTVKRIFVFLGGSDPGNVTEKAVRAIESVNLGGERVTADIVAGGINPHQERLRKLCSNLPWASYHCQVNYMAELMACADLAIGGGGATTWERCCLGLPSLVVIMAANQAVMTSHCESQGIIFSLGDADTVSADNICSLVKTMMASPDKVISLSRRSLEMVDGLGSQRVLAHMLSSKPEPDFSLGMA